MGLPYLALVVAAADESRETLAAQISRDRYTAISTDTVDGALKLIAAFTIDIILLDLGSHFRAGEQLLAEMVERAILVPVVVVSGSRTAPAVGKSFGLLVVTRPYHLQRLLGTLSVAIHNRIGPRRVEQSG